MTPAQIAHIMSLVDEYLYAPLKQKRAAIEAALRDAPQAEGWVMVPVEPTPEMLEAGEVEFRSYCLRHMFGHPAVWTAMLAARPSAPTAVEPDERAERDALAGRVAKLEAERDAALADSERRHTLLKMQHAESVELYNALSDLSFECDGVTCVLPPSRETYNRTFMVLKMKPHLSPAALRGHGEAGGTANATTEPKRDLMFATVAMQQREEDRIKRIVSGLEQVKQEHIASKGTPL